MIHTPEELKEILKESAAEFNKLDFDNIKLEPMSDEELSDMLEKDIIEIDTNMDIDKFYKEVGCIPLSEAMEYLDNKMDKYMSKIKE